MRWNVRRHTNGDATRSIEEHIREFGRQNNRLEKRAVKSRPKLNRVFANVAQQFHRGRPQSHLGITHGRRTVTIERSKIAVAIHQRSTKREALSHANHGVIDGGVPVRMVLPHHLTDDSGTLAESGVRIQVQIRVHRIEDAPLNRFQTISNIGQCTARNNG